MWNEKTTTLSLSWLGGNKHTQPNQQSAFHYWCYEGILKHMRAFQLVIHCQKRSVSGAFWRPELPQDSPSASLLELENWFWLLLPSAECVWAKGESNFVPHLSEGVKWIRGCNQWGGSDNLMNASTQLEARAGPFTVPYKREKGRKTVWSLASNVISITGFLFTLLLSQVATRMCPNAYTVHIWVELVKKCSPWLLCYGLESSYFHTQPTARGLRKLLREEVVYLALFRCFFLSFF